jgi:hypothetical protein
MEKKEISSWVTPQLSKLLKVLIFAASMNVCAALTSCGDNSSNEDMYTLDESSIHDAEDSGNNMIKRPSAPPSSNQTETVRLMYKANFLKTIDQVIKEAKVGLQYYYNTQNISITIADNERTLEKQREYDKLGSSKTIAGLHNYWLAVDIDISINGQYQSK